MITLCVMTDGRSDYITQTIASFEAMVSGKITRRVIHDDSGDPAYSKWLVRTFMYPDGPYGELKYDVVSGPRVGYSAAVQRAWDHLDNSWEDDNSPFDRDTNPFTFHLEDDFLFNRPVDLDLLAFFLDAKLHLAQIALRRGAWGREERGFVEDSPSAYEPKSQRYVAGVVEGDLHWLEHRLYYTMTPHLYRSSLRKVGWPQREGSEIHFRDKLLRDGLPWGVPGGSVKFGFWGGVEDGANAVTHIGFERVGHGY